jgi:hypothetical protein
MGSAHDVASSTYSGTQRAADQVAGSAGHIADKAGELADSAREAPDKMIDGTRGNPLAAGIIAFGVGLLLGSIAPPTAPEQRAVEALGEKIEPLKDKVMESAHNMQAEVGDSAREAVDVIKDESRAAFDDVKGQARDSAQEVKEQVTGPEAATQ